jgi:hypothetical protein
MTLKGKRMRWSDIQWGGGGSPAWDRAIGLARGCNLFRATRDNPLCAEGVFAVILAAGKGPLVSYNRDALLPPSQFGIPDVMAILAHHAGIEWEADDA